MVLMLFPFWIMIFIIPLIIALTIFWLWMLVDCITSELHVPEKLMWVLIILILNVIGAVLYLLLAEEGKKKKRKGAKLTRSRSNRMIFGVCGGLGEYMGIDPTIVRLIWILITIFSGFLVGVIAYLLAAIVIPEK